MHTGVAVLILAGFYIDGISVMGPNCQAKFMTFAVVGEKNHEVVDVTIVWI